MSMNLQAGRLEAALMADLHLLSAEIGPRPCGSPAHHAAEAALRDRFAQAGLHVVELRSDCVGWQAEAVALTLSDGRQLEARACTFAPACDVAAETTAVCTLAELETADLADRIAIFYGELSAEAILPLNYAIWNLEHHQRINRLLAAKQPAAVIAVNVKQVLAEPVFQDWDLAVPTAEVGVESGLALLAQVGQPAQLHMDTTRTPSHTTTLVGTRAGAGAGRIVVCAHYDTKFGTPGATDNGCGTAVLLAVARHFGTRPLATTLECVAFGDEEHYGLGDLAYVAAQTAGFDDIVACINIDGVGHALGTNTITVMGHADGLRAELEGIVRATPAVSWVEPWPQSNHSTFAWRGVPCVALTSTGTVHSAHLATDTVNMASGAKLAEAARLVIAIVEMLQGRSATWSRP